MVRSLYISCRSIEYHGYYGNTGQSPVVTMKSALEAAARYFAGIFGLQRQQDDSAFLQLVAVAKEDPDIRNRLIEILSQDAFQRKSSLNTWIRNMQLQKAPEPFVRAVSYLLDDEIAEQAMKVLGKL